MAQTLNNMPHKDENLSSIPSTHMKAKHGGAYLQCQGWRDRGRKIPAIS